MRTFHRLLLRAYPRRFRELYGAELEDAFHAMWTSVRGRGMAARVTFLTRTTLDTVRSGLRERMSTRGYRMPGGGGLRRPARGLATGLADLALDVRHTVRALRAAPGYVAAVIVTLALGIGANTALFSTAWGIFGRPLPFDDGSDLVRVAATRPDWREGMAGGPQLPLSVHEIHDLREVDGLASVAEYHRMTFTLIGPGGPALVDAGVVSSNWFELLGMRPTLGRALRPGEDEVGTPPVIVLGHEFWMETFDGDPDAVGSIVRMNGQPHEIVGVLPPMPQFPDVNDIYLPISACPTRSDPAFQADRSARMMTVYARLDDDVDVDAAGLAVGDAGARISEAHPDEYRIDGGWTLGAVSLREELVRDARPVVWPLIGIAALLLLAACANAAGLALSRANRRMDSLRIRAAVGADRLRLARELMTETVLLGLLGGLVGLSVAWSGTELLARFAADFTTRAQEIRLDAVPLLFALGLSGVTGIVFGLAPLLAVRRAHSLGTGRRATTGRGGRRAQRVLVGVQVAIAFAVVTGAGLLARSFGEAATTSVGFETESVVTAQFLGGRDRYPDATDVRDLLERVRERLASDPTFRAVARAPWAPLAHTMNGRESFRVGRGPDAWSPAVANVRAVDPEYFEVLGVELLEGRLPGPADTLGAEEVAVVNREFRDRWMAGTAEVGDLVASCPAETPCGEPVRIVGVVENMLANGADAEVVPEIYTPLEQTDWFASTLLARVAGDPRSALLTLVETARGLDPDLAVRDAGTLEEFRTERLAPRRFVAVLVLAFALVAAGLAFTGVFGVSALAAAARRREMGIRRVLGAPPAAAERLVLREGLGVALIGCAAGSALAVGTGELLRGLLFHVAPRDPWVFGIAWILFPLVALIACRIPARRAGRDDLRSVLGSS